MATAFNGGAQAGGQAPAGAFAQVSAVAQETSPLSFADNGPAKAGEGIRTLDVQLGKLAFYH